MPTNGSTLCHGCWQGVWLELRAAYQPPCRAAFEVMISACMTQPSGLEPALRVLQDMRSCGFDLDRMYYRPFMDLLGYDAIVMQNVLEPFRQNVGLIEVDDEELAALMFACMRNGMTPEQSSRRLNALGVGLPAVTMIYLRLDQPKSSAIMGQWQAGRLVAQPSVDGSWLCGWWVCQSASRC